jgi:hypothetical protein
LISGARCIVFPPAKDKIPGKLGDAFQRIAVITPSSGNLEGLCQEASSRC